jgi:hypothetical protein
LDLDGPYPLDAVDSLVAHMQDDCIPQDVDISTVIAQHNWSDPVGAQHLGLTLDGLLRGRRKEAELAWRSRDV